MESNEVLDRLPHHLRNLIINKPYSNYSAQDQAVWRYIMRQNVKFLPEVAHHSYLDGLKRTGISTDRIPHIYGMNRILKEIGWAAVAVDGFIPPAAFMEFQAHNVLVIAADIRSVDQVLYTPAPDILHEAAGHAPIIADEEYSAYLRDFGWVGTKAFSSAYDKKMYKAIRHLSILKSDPSSEFEANEKAEAELDHLSKLQKTPSEMALLRNLHWWTVEYGLIGTVENPKIYGAGLLSSIGESHNCLKQQVKKLPYSLDAQNYSFDITTQQPQLFVTPDFKFLSSVLNQYKEKMALRTGGMDALNKALQSEATSTVQYCSGLQVSGKLVKIHAYNNEPVYLGFEGPAMLSFDNNQIEGHGINYHKDGFGSPVGKIKDIVGNIEFMSEGELSSNGIKTGINLLLKFNSGVLVSGNLETITRKLGRNLVFSFLNCTVTYLNTVLFKPEWGMYDMAVGETIVSAFAGPADPDAFGLKYPAPREKTHHIHYNNEILRLHALYNEVRDLREKGGDIQVLERVWQRLKVNYPNEWLLPLEIAELLSQQKDHNFFTEEVSTFLDAFSGRSNETRILMESGLRLFTNP